MSFDLSDLNTADQSIGPARDKESIWEKELFSFSSAFSKKQKESFYLELGILLQSGIQLKDCLDLIGQATKKKKTKSIIQKLADRLVLGQSLSDSMAEQKVFEQYEVQSIRIGEETGKLPEIVNDLAVFFKSANSQRKELVSALTYPVIVLTTAVLVVYFMLNFVVPLFQDLFKRNNTELPWITKIVIQASELFNEYGLIVLGIVLAFYLVKRFLKDNKVYQKYKDLVLFHTPFLGKLITRNYINQFINAMSLLASAKVNISKSLNLIKGMITFYPLNSSIASIEQDLIQGDSQSQAFKKHSKLFDDKFIAMIQVAEQTNQDELVYQNLKQHYNNLLLQQTKTFTNLINPILTLVVGFIVGFILIALYLPMFKMSSLIN
jgi:type IV pilus assembly protein PilC